MGPPRSSASWPRSWQRGATPMKKRRYGRQASGSLRSQTLWKRKENKAHGSLLLRCHTIHVRHDGRLIGIFKSIWTVSAFTRTCAAVSKRHLVSPVGRTPPGAHLRMQKASPSSCEGMRKTLGLEAPTQQEFRRRIYLRPSVEFFNRADALFRRNSNGKTAKGE
jgi:hypothetical protein